MLGNRKDPLADVVKKVMDHNENERRIIAEFNSELGIKDRRQLPHEKRAAYDQALSERLNEETLDEAGYHEDGYAKSINEDLKGNQYKIDANKNKRIDAGDFKILRSMKEEGSVPSNAREADLAKKKRPFDRVTQADVLKARGVISQEEFKGDSVPFEAGEKKGKLQEADKKKKTVMVVLKEPKTEKGKQAKKGGGGVFKLPQHLYDPKKHDLVSEEQIDEVSTEKLVAYKNKASEGREKGSKLAYAKLTGKAKVKASMPKTPYMEEDIQQSGKEKPPVSTIDRIKDPNPPEKYTPKFGAENPNTGTKASAEDRAALQKKIEDIKEAAYSAKAARAGKDIGKPGKMFSKIAKKAGEKYGSEERGKKVAGAVLAKIRAKHMEEAVEHNDDNMDKAHTAYAKKRKLKILNHGWAMDDDGMVSKIRAHGRDEHTYLETEYDHDKKKYVHRLSEEEQLDEKAVSKAQHRFMGLVYAIKKGEAHGSPKAEKAAGEMSTKEVRKFAKTKEKGLPEKVDEQLLASIQEEIRTSLLEKAHWLKENGTQEQVVEFLNNLTMEQREILNIQERVLEAPSNYDETQTLFDRLGPGDPPAVLANVWGPRTPLTKNPASKPAPAPQANRSPAPQANGSAAPQTNGSAAPAAQTAPAPKGGQTQLPSPSQVTTDLTKIPGPGSADTGPTTTITPQSLGQPILKQVKQVEPAAPSPKAVTSTSTPAPTPAQKYGAGDSDAGFKRGLYSAPSASDNSAAANELRAKQYAVDRPSAVYESKSGKSLEKFLKEDFNGKKS